MAGFDKVESNQKHPQSKQGDNNERKKQNGGMPVNHDEYNKGYKGKSRSSNRSTNSLILPRLVTKKGSF